MRNDGRLYGLTHGNGQADSGNYAQLNTATGAVLSSSDDGMRAFVVTSEPEMGQPPAFSPSQYGIQFEAMAYWQSDNSTARRLFAVGRRHVLDDPNANLENDSAVAVETGNLLFELDPDTGEVLHEVDQDQTAWLSSGTDRIPIGTFENIGQIIGLAIIGDRMFGTTANGQLYEISNFLVQGDASDTASIASVGQLGLLAGASLTSLSAGPPHVEGGQYRDTLFALDRNGRLYAYDTDGNARGVFLNGATVINTGVSNASGLAFSSLDYNLWHATTNRRGDAGHGILPSPSNNVARTTQATDIDLLVGGGSFYFGLSPNPAPSDPDVPQPGAAAYGSNPDIISTYGLPGGAYGTLTSKTFDLAGYSALDKPTLYFNYLLDTPDNNSTVSATDAFRVFASTDGVNWELLATNNVTPNSETPPTITPSGGAYKAQSAKQKVQALYDGTLVDLETQETALAWRQARVDLGDYAGKSGIRLRFQFTTAGTMGSGNSLYGTGRVLKALPGTQIPNGSSFTISGQTFVFRKGEAADERNEIAISNADTSEMVAQKMAAALDRLFVANSAQQQVRVDASSGTFTLTFRNPTTQVEETTDPLQFNASAADVLAALETLPSINPGDVTVTSTATSRWTITFGGQYANTAVDLLTVTDIDLDTGADEIRVSINFTPQAQTVTLNGSLGDFTLNFKGTDANPLMPGQQTVPILHNATAAQVQQALEGLDDIDPGDVIVTGQPGGPYTIVFTGQYNNVLMEPLEFTDNLGGASIHAYTVSPDDPDIFTSAKVVGDELRLFSNTIDSAGILPFSNGQTTGDNHGNFLSRTRDRSNLEETFEGVYIDDFVVGFASRGEMVDGLAAQ